MLIGTGIVDFKVVFTKLKKLGYTGAISIERETSGPQADRGRQAGEGLPRTRAESI
jgi:sugar phosphate isomerase/epimerase